MQWILDKNPKESKRIYRCIINLIPIWLGYNSEFLLYSRSTSIVGSSQDDPVSFIIYHPRIIRGFFYCGSALNHTNACFHSPDRKTKLRKRPRDNVNVLYILTSLLIHVSRSRKLVELICRSAERKWQRGRVRERQKH